ncbi:MAG: prepilin-type N-terminal cleavage/methylation domain-containing protein [Phycisphaeraceae bacterium]
MPYHTPCNFVSCRAAARGPHAARRRAGFTIIELIVSIGITVMLMTLVNQLFRETTRAVNVGVKTSAILSEAEIIGDQIKRDAAQMLGPRDDGGTAGFLVIVNRRIGYNDNAPFDTERLRHGKPIYEGNEMEDGNVIPLMYRGYPIIESNGHLYDDPRDADVATGHRVDQIIFIAGDSDDTNAPPFRSLTPKYADTLGSDVTARHARVWLGHVVQIDPNVVEQAGEDNTSQLGAPRNVNRFASDWTLGRHVLLLAERERGNFDPLNDPKDVIHAENASWWTNEVFGTLSPIDDPTLDRALTDVADQPLRHPDPPGPQGVLDEIEDGGGGYFGNVAGFALPHQYRVFVNDTPTYDDFEAWQLAQMHTRLGANVSDFIVEFAGDYDGTPGLDRDDDTGEIVWYSHFPNHPDYPGYDPSRPVVEPVAGNIDIDAAREPEPSTSTTPDRNTWYYNDGSGVGVFVWRHDDHPGTGDPDDTKWPYLIRIRYRLQDPRGFVRSTVQFYNEAGELDAVEIPGQWFEHIIRVPRPDDN